MRSTVLVFAAAAAAMLLACGGSSDDDGDGATALTGVLVGDGGACGAATVRVIAGDVQSDAAVGADCRFTAPVAPATYAYAQLLDDGGAVIATLAWQDPTVLNDGMSLVMTSWFKLPAGVTHDLDEVFVIDLQGNIETATVTAPSYAGAGGLLVAWPFLPPFGYDTDGNGIPDENEVGFRTGSDTTGDGVPDGPTVEPCAPAPAPLYGQLSITLLRDDLTAAELEEVMNAGGAPDGITMMEDGFTRGPIPVRGAWVVISDQLQFMADENGVVTIDSLPTGVASAKVYKNPGDPLPFMYLPLCALGTDAAFPPTVDHMRIYPDPCHMQSKAAAECRGDATEEEIEEALEEADEGGGARAHHAHGGDEPQTHKACAAGANYPPCCLDYDGYDSLPGKPHNARAFIAYWGSTCERYVDANCCINEGGTIGGRLAGGLGLKQLTTCWRNHYYRNCQTIALDDTGLVLSTSAAVRDAHDPTTSPESITIACGSTLTLYHYNNTCQNEDRITHIGDLCGTLSPQGVLPHRVTNRQPVLERDLTFTAPDQPCEAAVVTHAWGYSRRVNITVVCDDTTGACCFTNGDCQDGATPNACSEAGGVFSAGMSCDEVSCGACCKSDNSCVDNAQPSACMSAGDRYIPGGQCATLDCATDVVQAVVLDYDLGVPAAYNAGDIIEVSRMNGGFVAGPDVGCPGKDHYHADGPVFIDGINGPYEDMARTNCGFGQVIYIAVP